MLNRPTAGARRYRWLLPAALLALGGCARSTSVRADAVTAEFVIGQIESRDRVPREQAPDAGSPAPAAASAEAKPAAEAPVNLTLLEALHYALRGNHEIQIAAYEPLRAGADVSIAQAVFDPTVFFTNNFGRTDRPIQSLLDTGEVREGALVEDTWDFQGGARQPFLTGGTFSLFQNLSYLDTNSTLTFPNPQYRAGLTAELKQPLLKGLGAVVNRAAIRVANLNADVSYEQFRRKVIEVVADVTALYWQMVYEGELVRIDRESLDLAQEVLRREEVRFRQGISKEVDVARAQAAAGGRQTRLVRSEVRLQNTVERLKLLLNAPEVPLDSEVIVVPAERLAYRVTDVVRSEAVSKALAHRPDLAGARKAIEANQVRVDAARHDRLPKLDSVLRYTMNGLNTDLGNAMADQHLTDPFSWVAGLEFEMPIGNRAANAEHRKRRFEYQQSLLDADLIASRAIQEVNVAVRTVNTARAEVDAARRARDAAAATVKGENVRFELNQVANQDLLIAQDVLAAAERDYLESVLNFNLALTELGRAQGTLLESAGIELIDPEAKPAK